jgi:hypothetical protein
MYNILNINQKDYDNIYIVGDIHGMFHLLEEEMKKVNFNKEKDLIVCCGDLIDRGKNSLQAIKYIQEPWFVSVFGNHDYKFMPIPNYYFNELFPPLEYFDRELTYKVEKEFREVFPKFLYAGIEINLNTKEKVAIVHSEIPFGIEWNVFKKYLEKGYFEALKYGIWERNISKLHQLKIKIDTGKVTEESYKNFIKRNRLGKEFKKLKNSKLKSFNKIYEYYFEKGSVSDLKASFHGHSIINSNGEIMNFKNRYFLDTGAFLTEEFISNHKGNEKYVPEKNNKYKLSLFNLESLNNIL